MATTLHERIISVVGERTYRNVSGLTNTNSETVRRYMTGCSPSAEFLSGLCQSLGVSGHWLLTGRGPMRESEMMQDALRQAKAGDLMSAMADTIQKLITRVESLERYVQQIDTRVRARAATTADGAPETGESDDPQAAQLGRPATPGAVAPLGIGGSDGVQVVRNPLAERTRRDAR